MKSKLSTYQNKKGKRNPPKNWGKKGYKKDDREPAMEYRREGKRTEGRKKIINK